MTTRSFTDQDSWSSFIEAAWERNLQLGDPIPRQDCDVWVYAESLEASTIKEAAALLDGPLGQKLSSWGLICVGDFCPPFLKERLITCVCQDPALASIVYQRSPYLNDEEKKILWSAFEEKLPVTVRKLRQKEVNPDG